MDANQRSRSNPFGMDDTCRNCPTLCETRSRIVHGYGDVGADFLFVGEAPTATNEALGVPLLGGEEDGLRRILERLGLCAMGAPEDEPELVDVYVTALTRCRHPDRPPSADEVRNCEPFLEAEIRMINPEIIVPVGARALEELAVEYTTKAADSFDVDSHHGDRIRGRGFELVPMVDPRDQTDAQTQAWIEAFASILASDYRQTKGGRER
ncbi:MAG: uracil-DNA glycosylase [Halobacteriota archaeon]